MVLERPAGQLIRLTIITGVTAALIGCSGSTSTSNTSVTRSDASTRPIATTSRTGSPSAHTLAAATTSRSATTTPRHSFQPIDPFAPHKAFNKSGTASNTVFPAGHEGFDGRPGVSSSPQFSLFGDLPNSGSSGNRHRMANDATENLRQISFGSEGSDFDPCISRDGQRMYFASTRHRPTGDIYVKSINGRSVTQLTSDPAHDVMPAESPDGQRIAFASNRNGSWDIYVTNAFGGQAVQITSDSGQELHPTWSPDGSTLAYCRLSERGDRWELWTVDVNNTAVSRFVAYGLFPEWHPTGNKILFQRSRDRGDRFFSIWTIDYVNGEGVSPTELASSPVAALINPTWSPDGSQVAFATVFNPNAMSATSKPETADLWIMDVNGNSRANLTGGWHVNYMPTWGDDGRLYFVSNRNDADNIWSIGPEQAMVAAGNASAQDSSYAEYVPGVTSPTATATVPVPADSGP